MKIHFQNSKTKKIAFVGDGVEKSKTILQLPNADFIEGVHPSAKNMIGPAEIKFKKGEFEDVAYFEPFYLKEFRAGK